MKPKRSYEIAGDLSAAGFKRKEIAWRMGVSVGYVSILLRTHAWRLKQRQITAPCWDDGLSTRTANCLRRAGGINSREDAREAIISGRLLPNSVRSYGQCRGSVWNYGWKSHVELCAFLGLPAPQKKRRCLEEAEEISRLREVLKTLVERTQTLDAREREELVRLRNVVASDVSTIRGLRDQVAAMTQELAELRAQLAKAR